MKLFLFIGFCFLLQPVRTECSKGMDWQSNCYIFYNNTNDAAGFARAEKICNDARGHLASIHDPLTNDLIAQSSALTNKTMWIGANNFVTKGNWTWTDGTPLDFTKWKSGEDVSTSSSCISLSAKDGYWTADDCFLQKDFVCIV